MVLNLLHYLNATSVVRSYMKIENVFILKVVVMIAVTVVVIVNLNWKETPLRRGFLLYLLPLEPQINRYRCMA